MAPSKEKKATVVAKDSPSTSMKSSKMHRRSRSGCFTCRLRRKKCDEAKPKCKACRHLGLDCEYKRPHWWSNNETRRKHKEFIKSIIKRTKTNEKNLAAQSNYATRGSSTDSQDDYDADFDPSFATTPGLFTPYTSDMYMTHDPYSQGFPWEVDVKTEMHTYVNDELTRRDSSISTFSTWVPPPPHAMLPSYTGDDFVQPELYEHKQDSWAGEDPVAFNFFDFNHLAQQPGPQCSMIHLEDCDRPLFNHLLDNVLPLLFPVLEANQPGSVSADVALPALEHNKAYLHSCLLAAATHMKDIRTALGTAVDDDQMRHKLAFVTIVVEALNGDTHHSEMLDALLGMISLQGCVGSATDLEKELIPWHQHFQTAADIVQKLNLPSILEGLNVTGGHPPFNMTLAAWIDILGSTMLGKAPRFSNTYRNMFFAQANAGLEKLMGCNDLVMYLLSEVACLDSLKMEGRLDDIGMCSHITSLAQTLDQIEPTELPQIPYSKSGVLKPKQLTKNITAVFRKAARVYLCSLVPEYNRYQPATVNLIAQMADLMQYIPSGPNGFDRCLVWPMLICGVNSIPASPFRRVLSERCEMLGDAADHGSFGRMVRLLHEVWRLNDDMIISAGVCEATPVTAGSPGGSISTPITVAATANPGSVPGSSSTTTTVPRNQNVHWRDVMQQNGWDFLLM
ncbi:DNA-binding transcriptional regulator ume6 [Exophiala xenobiotica]|nr:DNA-binding transcriptional regulator ume6 [Exophiala xenobiotica]KAK5219511.1 DNA-binding transcriptional regulator ume6 [Exophiala xenobiotica]KAK5219717.1 DNA-binding transcriptional regulator ume6 [Exophiala xenobiotica]KAK5252541.1 DNA-binding transcriptional regulator ume6 [Exophiala xenobiotica]KAK5288263.1 DNA-binding transcriptional regulator ume6 [Exophiala xenobiotica]